MDTMNNPRHPSTDISSYLMTMRALVYGLINAVYTLLPPVKNNLIVLNYHGIGDNGYRFDVTEESFREHIAYFLKQGYKFISVAELERWFDRGGIPNGLYALLTFDDGNRSVLKVRSFLKEHGIKPAIFVLTESEKTDRTVLSPEFEPMTDADLVLIQKEGWEIGGHTATHPHLPRVIDDASIAHELVDSKKALEKILEAKTDYFAYPHGAYDAKIIDKVIGAGYTLAFSTDESRIDTRIHRYVVPRVGINKSHDLSGLKAVITPLSLRLKPLIKRLYA